MTSRCTLSDPSLFLGPKVNTVEKLAELRKAGVNVGGFFVLSRPIPTK